MNILRYLLHFFGGEIELYMDIIHKDAHGVRVWKRGIGFEGIIMTVLNVNELRPHLHSLREIVDKITIVSFFLIYVIFNICLNIYDIYFFFYKDIMGTNSANFSLNC